MPKKRHNPLCRCRKTGAWRSREAARRALERVQAAIAATPDRTIFYAPVAIRRCTSKRGVWHLTSKSGKTGRGQRRSNG